MMIAANALFLMDTASTQDERDNGDDENADLRRTADRRAERCKGGPGAAGGVIAITWCTLQLAVPLRHHTYEGPVVWTGEGYHFSWMMVRKSH
jgi:hypothetical protein